MAGQFRTRGCASAPARNPSGKRAANVSRAQASGQVGSLKPCVQEAAIKCITGAGGFDGPHFQAAGLPPPAVRPNGHRSPGSELDDNTLAGLSQAAQGGGRG